MNNFQVSNVSTCFSFPLGLRTWWLINFRCLRGGLGHLHDLNRRQLDREGRKEQGSSGRAWPRASCCDSHKACLGCVKEAPRMNVPWRCSLRASSGWFSDMLRLCGQGCEWKLNLRETRVVSLCINGCYSAPPNKLLK